MPSALRTRIAAHPVAAFFVLAYALSWTLWIPATITGLDGLAVLPFFLGVFGPATAAAVVVHATGGSARAWARGLLRWRVAARWYALAIAFPVGLAVVASAQFALAGESLDFGLLGERAAAFLPLLAFCLVLNGGPEEPGWRGFALPRLQDRMTPVRATVVLGVLWALWHLPLLAIEENAGHDLAPIPLVAMELWTLAGFVAYAFTYTYLYNRTGSVLLCMLLHAAYNTALGVVILRPEDELTGSTYVIISLCLTGTLILAAAALTLATRGRLGLERAARAPRPERPVAGTAPHRAATGHPA